MNSAAEPTISIIVLSWNTRELLLACLESLAKALTEWSAAPAEVIVVDNGSADGSADAVAQRFPDFELVRLERNTGYAHGMNEGLRRARGPICATLNSDTIVTSDALRRCCETLEADRDIAAVAPQLVHPDGRLQNSVHAFPSALTELVPSLVLELALPARFPSKRRLPAIPTEVPAALGAALFISRKAIQRVGVFNEDYFFFLEDTDWCFRARAAGLRIVHVPEARIEHLSGGSSKRRDAAMTRIEFHRSLYCFLRLHRGRGVLALALTLRVCKGALGVGLLTLAAPFSAQLRRRRSERAKLLAWHLRGCPAGPGVAEIESSATYQGSVV